jgi:dienelactone hydrolase
MIRRFQTEPPRNIGALGQDKVEAMDQENRRRELYGLLGDLPDRARLVSAHTISEAQSDGYTVERLVLDLNGIEPVPAVFVRPTGNTGPFPCVLYHHAHGANYGLGKEELLEGRPELYRPAYAVELTRHGIAALCLDAWLFGERRGRTESELFKEMLWQGRVLWGMMVYDGLRAVDYLLSRSDVTSTRIATMGLSMGSTMAWWLAALDTRIQVCVDLCCLTDFHALLESRGLDEHGVYYYVPSLLKHFTTADIVALIAPRPHLGLAGNHDRLTPAKGLDRIDATVSRVYRELGSPEKWQLLRYQIGHLETAQMRAEVLSFLQRWL